MRFIKSELPWVLGGAAIVYLVLLPFGLVPAIPSKYSDSISLGVTAIATAVVACLTVTLAAVGRQQVKDTRITSARISKRERWRHQPISHD
jgi:hypothetical protein